MEFKHVLYLDRYILNHVQCVICIEKENWFSSIYDILTTLSAPPQILIPMRGIFAVVDIYRGIVQKYR